MSTEDTIFTKIIHREIPAHIVYEDDATLAFLDINPVNKGHTLVIPKKPVRNIFDADDATLASIMHTVRLLAPVIKEATGAHGMNIHSNHEVAAGQEVFHLHFHLIPRFENDGHVSSWTHTAYADGEAAAVAQKIQTRLS